MSWILATAPFSPQVTAIVLLSLAVGGCLLWLGWLVFVRWCEHKETMHRETELNRIDEITIASLEAQLRKAKSALPAGENPPAPPERFRPEPPTGTVHVE